MEGMTQPIWQGWMQAVHKNLKPEDRAKPAGIQTLPAFIVRTNPGIGAVVPSPSTDIFPSWYKGSQKKTGSARTIDIVSNKGATDCTPQRARKDITDTAANSFSVDKFVDGGSAGANTSEQDDIHKCDDIKPSITLSVSPSGSGKYHLVASVGQGTHALSSDQYPGTVTFSIDGQILAGGSFSISSPGNVTFDYNDATFDGTKTVTATIVDSVLYDASDAATITGSGGGGGGQTNGPLTLLSAKKNGTNVKFTWSGGTGTYSVYRTSNNALLCSGGIGDTSCSGLLISSPVGTAVYIKDSGGSPQSDGTVVN
jgi:hypothetical protein